MRIALLQSVAVRPEPGLAQGKWEAQPWFFVVVLVVAVLVPAAVLVRKKMKEARDRAPTSLRGSIPPPSMRPPKGKP